MTDWERKFRSDARVAVKRAGSLWEARFGRVAGGEGQATWNSVIAAFPKVQAQWEGLARDARGYFMYSDSIGYVTTGMGNKIDDSPRAPDGVHAAQDMTAYQKALALPWELPDGSRASQDEIISEWQLVKDLYYSQGVQSFADGPHTQLRLPQSAIDKLVAAQLAVNEQVLVKYLPAFPSAPADAQMATHGNAWAMGPGFVAGFPGFRAAFNARDWKSAKAQSGFRLEAPQRKAGQDAMWDNALAVEQRKLNPSVLYYPGTPPLSAPGSRWPELVAVALVASAAGGVAYHYRDEWVPPARRAYAQVSGSAARGLRDAKHAVAGLFSSPKTKRLQRA